MEENKNEENVIEPDEVINKSEDGYKKESLKKEDESSAKTMGILAIVLGGLSIALSCCCPFINYIFAIAAIVLGVIGMGKGEEHKLMCKIGLILGIIGIVGDLVLILLFVLFSFSIPFGY